MRLSPVVSAACARRMAVFVAVTVTAAVGRAQPAPVRRLPADSIWRRLWAIGVESTSETFVEPRQIVVSNGLVLVLDMGTREVHALDARTGATRFVLKATGEGPGEFRRPAMITATPNGFAIIDHATARLTTYDARGRFRWSTTLTDVFSINGVCIRDGHRIVATLTRRDSSVVEFDSTGRRVAVRSIPWRELVRDAVGFAYFHSTSAASAAGTCVSAPLFGAEWAVIPPTGAPRVFRVVEPGPQPVVVVTKRVLEQTLTKRTVQNNQQSDTPQASRAAMIVGDTVILNASATRTFPNQWLDYFRASTGEYRYSRKLPVIANAIAAGTDGTLYLTHIGEKSSTVVALRPATVAEAQASKKPQKPQKRER
jgi:outer membrane protein assembly factor BamB